MPERSRAWVFTINNYTDTDVDHVLDLSARYFCFGFEESKDPVLERITPHLQGYIYFDDAKTRKTVSNMCPRAYLAVANGNTAQNVVYTSKEGEFYEFGEIPAQGATPWDKIEEALKDPKAHPKTYIQYRRYYNDINNVYKAGRKCKFYSLCPDFDSDPITTLHDHFGWPEYDEPPKVAVIYESMDELEAYDDYDIIIYFCDYVSPIMQNWPRGVPISYKYGYERKRIYPTVMILVTDCQTSQLYKKI